jgi:DNA topoisomerase-6 subunit B
MSSFGQTDGVAKELADEQRQASIAEFFEKNKQMLGFGSENRALVTAVKEGVDNSLDAAEEARILPDIIVEITKNDEYYTVSIEDNGPGIPVDSVPSVFGKLLYGSRFHREMQQRGQQGIGISAAVLYSQLTSGNPARVTSKTTESDKANYVEIGIDTDNNDAVIHKQEEVEWEDKDHGIKIELDMKANMRARKRLHQYIKNTSVINPHATIELHEPEHDLIFDDRPIDELPAEVEEIKPHPHGVELGTLLDMLEATDSRKLRSFLKTEFTRVGDKTAISIIDHYRDIKYGRYLEWKIESEKVSKEDYIETIQNSVNRKGKEQTEKFGRYIYEEMTDYGEKIGYGGIMDAVSQAAQRTEDETDKTFGETVQERAYESIWNVLEQNVGLTIEENVNQATVDRKSQELIDMVVWKIDEVVRTKGAKKLTESELMSVINNSAESAVSTYDGSGSFGEKAQDKVFQEFWNGTETFRGDIPTVSQLRGNREESRILLEGMRKADAMAPPKKCISPITEPHIEQGLRSRYDADFYTASTRSAKVAGGKPFVVEAGIAYGGQIDPDGQITLNRFANRVPLVYQQGACAITKKVKSIRWNNYYRGGDSLTQNSGSIPQGPMVLLVHIASTNVPFTSESKDAVAGVPEMEEEVERAVREVARDLKDHLKEERTRRKRKQKRDVIGDLLSDMTDKIETITEDSIDSKKQSQARILNNVYVRKSGKKTIRITNYGGKKHDVEVNIKTESGSRSRSKTVSKGESASISIPDVIESFEVTNPSEARVTMNRP